MVRLWAAIGGNEVDTTKLAIHWAAAANARAAARIRLGNISPSRTHTTGPQDIPKKTGPEGDQDWEKFEATLKEHKTSAFFTNPERNDLEIAAESTTAAPVKYQDIIHAMDIAVKVGFTDVGLSDPQGLAARPSL